MTPRPSCKHVAGNGPETSSSGFVCRRAHSIASLVGTVAELAPERIAIAAPDRVPLTYRRLRLLIHEVRSRLNEVGIRCNDRVAVIVPNGPEMAAAFLAVAASATCAPLNPGYRQREFDSYFSDLGVKALIATPESDSPAIAAARRRGIDIIALEAQPASEAGTFALSPQNRRRTTNAGFSQPGDAALLLHTSGTTARPKLVQLTHANICASACSIATGLGLTERDRCLNVMPLYHIHGLVGATLSTLAAGGSIFCAPGFEPTRFFAWLEQFRPSWYTAVPTIHEAILAASTVHAEVIQRRPLRFIRACSAPLPTTVMAALERVFNAPVIEAYGMTEASHQITSNPLPPQRRKLGSVGLPAGAEVGIVDETGGALPVGSPGEIVIRGPGVIQGYEHRPPGEPESFVDGWLRTGDQGYLDTDGYLYINGRIKDVINRGGEKVSPREVEEVLLAHPAVAQAAVFAVPHRTLGEDIAAAIVLKENSEATEDALRQFAAARLADFRVPSRLVFVEDIPKGQTGKIQRSGLARQFAPHLQSRFFAPGSPLERELSNIWSRVLQIEKVGVRDNFFELGGSSLSAVRMLNEVQKLTGRTLPPSTLLTAPTIHALAENLSQESQPQTTPALVSIQPGGPRKPFFCVHGLEGDVLFLRHLAPHLGPDQPFYALRQLGLDGIQPPHTRVEDMAAHYVREITAFQPDGPFFLGGYSFGGLVAYEMAQQLCEQGRQVAFLGLIDTDFPNLPQPPESWWSDLAFQLRRVGFHIDNIRELGPQYVFERLARRIWSSANPSLTEEPSAAQISERPLLVEEFEKLNIQTKLRYFPRSYRGRLTLFLRRHLSKLYRDDPDDPRVPRHLALGGIDIQKISGAHLNLVVEPHVGVLGRKLRASLDQAMRPRRHAGRRDRRPPARNGRVERVP